MYGKSIHISYKNILFAEGAAGAVEAGGWAAVGEAGAGWGLWCCTRFVVADVRVLLVDLELFFGGKWIGTLERFKIHSLSFGEATGQRTTYPSMGLIIRLKRLLSLLSSLVEQGGALALWRHGLKAI